MNSIYSQNAHSQQISPPTVHCGPITTRVLTSAPQQISHHSSDPTLSALHCKVSNPFTGGGRAESRLTNRHKITLTYDTRLTSLSRTKITSLPHTIRRQPSEIQARFHKTGQAPSHQIYTSLAHTLVLSTFCHPQPHHGDDPNSRMSAQVFLAPTTATANLKRG